MTSLVPITGGTGLISREDLAKSLNNAAMSMPSVGGDKSFLKMDRMNGDWLFGQEETVVEPDSLWAANPTSLKHGWVAWDTNGGGAPVHEVMVPISRPLPAVETLPPLGMGTPDKKTGRAEQLVYQRQQSVDLVCISGEDEGTQVEYKQSSTGAMKMFAALTNSLLDQLSKEPDLIVPVGNLAFEAYKHKQYGKIHNPIFKIVEWRGVDDTSPVDPEVAKEEPAPAARTRTRAAAPEPAVEEQDNDAALAAEYEQTAAAEATPRRRQRR
ncbi:MAG: hypothetical protein WC829_07010 [Hyphomicrobium sp.]|jgi:hypothetical protein